MSDVQTILTAVRDEFGISFSETMTGGGCMALEARLESGHWIVATDEGLNGFRERIELEDLHQSPMGWMVGIYENNTDHGEDWWGGSEAILDVSFYEAYAPKLPAVVGEALSLLLRNSKR